MKHLKRFNEEFTDPQMWLLGAGIAVAIGHKVYNFIQKRRYEKQIDSKLSEMTIGINKMIAGSDKIKITDYGHLYYINAEGVDIRIIKDTKKITFADGSKVYGGFKLSDEEYTEMVSLIKNRK